MSDMMDAKALSEQLLAFVETMKQASDVLLEYDRLSKQANTEADVPRPAAGKQGSARNQSTYHWPATLR